MLQLGTGCANRTAGPARTSVRGFAILPQQYERSTRARIIRRARRGRDEAVSRAPAGAGEARVRPDRAGRAEPGEAACRRLTRWYQLMETVAVYRAGRNYSLDPPGTEAERVTLVLEEGARVQG